ncbi:MAG: hypothetical protein J0I93_11305 [Legionella sp.]|nr:hypothetical protein [Legionella sp.]
MEPCRTASTASPHLLLMDDHPLSTFLVLQLLALLDCSVTHARPGLPALKPTIFDGLLVNLSCIPEDIQQNSFLWLSSPVMIGYTPTVLVHDFQETERRIGRPPRDGQWMRHTELYSRLKSSMGRALDSRAESWVSGTPSLPRVFSLFLPNDKEKLD